MVDAPNLRFWRALDELAATCPAIIDRPKGTHHPRYPAIVYPLDYGYLEGTRSTDGGGIDVWVGSITGRPVTGVVYTVDPVKRDSEMKLLLGCTAEEARTIVAFQNTGPMSAMLVERPPSGVH